MTTQAVWKGRLFTRLRRAVIKIGSSTLSGTEGIRKDRLRSLAGEICQLRAAGLEIAVVTSGAVAAGMARLGWRERPRTLPQRQAAAAVGQIDLMSLYEEYCAEHGVQVAQILLTHDDLASRSRYLNARHTLETLLEARVLPVVNENDTVVTEELRGFGDNDNLSALFAGLMEADLLVLLSDVDGVYTANPRTHPEAQLLSVIEDIDAPPPVSLEGQGTFGTGGMASKVVAAGKAAHAGIPTLIADGSRPGILPGIFDPGVGVGTLILPKEDRLGRRKHWIAFTLVPMGSLVVDAGAIEAVVTQGRSLLPSGIREVQGRFGPGDCVRCVSETGEEFARGLVNYGSAELDRLKGLQSSRIEAVLGYRSTDEAIHRNDLVIVRSPA